MYGIDTRRSQDSMQEQYTNTRGTCSSVGSVSSALCLLPSSLSVGACVADRCVCGEHRGRYISEDDNTEHREVKLRNS